jgi:hypothetical protein
LVNGFIDHLYTRLVITSNYRATANLHSSQITTVHAKPFPAYCVFTSRFLTTAFNSGDPSASRAEVLSSQTPVQNSSELTTELVESQSHIATDGQSVSKSWSRAPSGAHNQIFSTVRHLRSCFCGMSCLKRGRFCFCISCWSLPAQSFSGPSPLGLATIFCCLRFKTSISSPPTTRRVMVELFYPASTRVLSWSPQLSSR